MAMQKACAIMQSCYKLCKDYYGICQKRQDQTVTSIRGYKNLGFVWFPAFKGTLTPR